MHWKAVAEACCELGEGLFWDATRQRLWFVDIVGQQLLAIAADGTNFRRRPMPQRLGWAIPRRGHTDWLIGFQEGFALVSPEESELVLHWLARPFANPALRLNDAKADSSGAVWAGSMNNDDQSRPDGCLFRLAPDGTLTVHDTGYCVANGPALSPDERLMLHTDSARRTIYGFDLDVAAGQIANKRVWLRFEGDEGYPDGMCFDADGCLWVAHWGAGCVSRFAPNGALLRRILLPTSHITNVCFGGPGLDRLFVSSARAGLSEDQLRREPLAGALFEVLEPGAVGLPGRPYGRL